MLTVPVQPFQSKTCNLPENKFALWAGGVADQEACAHLGANPVLCSAVQGRLDWNLLTCYFTPTT